MVRSYFTKQTIYYLLLLTLPWLLIPNCANDRDEKKFTTIKQGPFIIFPDSITEGKKTSYSDDGETLISDYYGSEELWRANLTTLKYPRLVSHRPIVDAVYLMAIESIQKNIVDGEFHASAGWNELYTRDCAYGIHLSAGLLFPRESWESILSSVTRKMNDTGYNNRNQDQGSRNGNIYFDMDGGDYQVAYQDLSKSFGGWPHSTDAIVWAIGVWEFHAMYGLTKGDLQWVYHILLNSLRRPRQQTYEYLLENGWYKWNRYDSPFDTTDGLIRGIASYIDDRSGYPQHLAGTGDNRITNCKFLSTNALYYRGYMVAAEIGHSLERPIVEIDELRKSAAELKKAINKYLWLEDKGYFAYYRDTNGALSDRMDALGHVFVGLWDISDIKRIKKFMDRLQYCDFGIKILAPGYYKTMASTLPDNSARFNGNVWPFVQAYWAWVGALNNRMDIFTREFAALLRLGAFSMNFTEYVHPENGEPGGAKNHFCAAAGFLSTVLHGLFGMNFSPEGIFFSPIVPAFFDSLAITNVSYRLATIDLKIIGHGIKITQFVIDDVVHDQPFFSSSLRNRHRIKIYLEEF